MASRNARIYAGIMSGTSLDGIDIVFAEFDDTQITLRGYYEEPYTDELVTLLHQLSGASQLDAELFFRTDAFLAQVYSEAVVRALEACRLKSADIRAIGLHGQTIRHLSKPRAVGTLGSASATVQIGSGPALAALSGIDVVYDFRSADVALGGEGAPLVPMFDKHFLASHKADRLIINIGGMANITWLPAMNVDAGIRSFDTGPGNVLIDLLTKKYFGESYDALGNHARRGRVENVLLGAMLADPFFSLAPPKSTGRELFNEAFVSELVAGVSLGRLTAEDAIATATELTAATLGGALKFVEPTSEHCEVIVSGGGAKNIFLLERLRATLSAARVSATVYTSETIGIPTQQKEALAFAWFAKARIEENIIHLPKTTGATRALILGSVVRG